MNGSPAAGQGPLLKVDELHLHLGSHHVLQGVSLVIDAGQVQCIMGPSGCGKSSLLRCLNFLEVPSSGSILFRNHPVGYTTTWFGNRKWAGAVPLRRYRCEVGMVFQGFNIWPHLTAFDNLLLPLRRIGKLKDEVGRQRAEHALARVGLKDKHRAFASELSGGQLQRLAIARALAMQPAVLLLDEPTSSLDPELVQEVVGVIRDLALHGMTMVIVTHEVELARSIGDRLMFMDQGRIIEAGEPSTLIEQPRSARLHSFLGTLLR